MSEALVEMTVNPCKMCMPMGAALALKGLENSMMLLHGSQGCSTYIRRHMAGHYHEPVDIASSSLTEHGTVHGGEKNLVKGLENLISLYNPEIIGVATTCLAETIGEDVHRMLATFRQTHPGAPALIPVPTPGYSGTHFEGYFAALRATVESLTGAYPQHQKINVILPPCSPADAREIRDILDAMGVEATLFPDPSDTLDAPWSPDWKRIPEGGTALEDIRRMAGAPVTLELCETLNDKLSPGIWLRDTFQVPFHRLPFPAGLEATDIFVEMLSAVSGKPPVRKLLRQRGRLLDGMVDAHKYMGEARTAISGDPETVLALSRICIENGVHAALCATGAESPELEGPIRKLENDPQKPSMVCTGMDYKTIRSLMEGKAFNLILGPSDARYLEEHLNIPLIRIGFPVHDRLGGQRYPVAGYQGALRVIDDISNQMMRARAGSYKEKARGFLSSLESFASVQGSVAEAVPVKSASAMLPADLERRTKEHPCYTKGACQNARVHLPVAPKCNIACNYCNRKYDCVNESRPGVTSLVLSPEAAIEKYKVLKEKVPNLKVVGIAGPGDAMADFANVSATLRGIRALDPDVTFCLSTNGLLLPHHAYELVEMGVTHITVTMNAIDPEIGAQIYREVRYQGQKLTGVEGARRLIANQLDGIRMLTSLGVMVKINTVFVPGINEDHIPEVVRTVAALGAEISNIMPLIPAEGSRFAHLPMVSRKRLDALRESCAPYLKQMTHCKQCRADAVGRLDDDRSLELMTHRETPEKVLLAPRGPQWLAAVATESGNRVDKHFGQVDAFSIYQVTESGIHFMEKREVPRYCQGPECSGDDKTTRMLSVLKDVQMVVALRIGHHPMEALEKARIHVVQSCDRVETALKEAFEKLTTEQVVSGIDQ